jgi:hypothetical protein
MRGGGGVREANGEDVEMGEWYGQDKKSVTMQGKQEGKKEEKDRLPFVARTIISVLTFAFKSVVFMIRIAVKIVAGVVVMITRNLSKL